MVENLTEISEKQVVNLCDGRILGHVIDFKINLCSGCLTAIVLPGETGFFGFKKRADKYVNKLICVRECEQNCYYKIENFKPLHF